MREVCGTVNAMAMLAGFKYPVFDPLDQEARARNYGMVQKNGGFIQGEAWDDHLPQPSSSGRDIDESLSFRTHATVLCQKRPCGKYVKEAARIAGHMLKGELE